MTRRSAETASSFPPTHPHVSDLRTPVTEHWAARASDSMVLLGRLAMGGVFVASGAGKLLYLSGFAAVLARHDLPFPVVLAAVGAMVEFTGGMALVLGFQTRAAALLMVAFTVVATLIAHRFWNYEGADRVLQQIQFVKNIAILGGLLVLFASGSGRYGLDRWAVRR